MDSGVGVCWVVVSCVDEVDGDGCFGNGVEFVDGGHRVRIHSMQSAVMTAVRSQHRMIRDQPRIVYITGAPPETTRATDTLGCLVALDEESPGMS